MISVPTIPTYGDDKDEDDGCPVVVVRRRRRNFPPFIFFGWLDLFQCFIRFPSALLIFSLFLFTHIDNADHIIPFLCHYIFHFHIIYLLLRYPHFLYTLYISKDTFRNQRANVNSE